MTHTYWPYLKNIFINPRKAAISILDEKSTTLVAVYSFLIGSLLYVAIVLMGYNALGWSEFPYKDYYPHYFSPYLWEVFIVPVWGMAIAFGFGIPCYSIGRLLGGRGSLRQVIAFVLLASIVSLPLMVAVDTLTILYDPEWIVRFAKYGENYVPYQSYNNKIVWFVETSYVYIGMTWQGIVTILGLSVIHKINWYKNLPGIVLGFGIFFLFLFLIRSYVALII
jgi:hypothetical protein